jgi:translocation protein SEC63
VINRHPHQLHCQLQIRHHLILLLSLLLPNHVTSLIDREEVELKFTAPQKPGHYSFTVCLRSDSYLGVDVQEDIKLEVAEAREAPEQHPQWEFEDDEEEEGSKEESSDDEFATDSEADEDDD